jgi:hypothetical protein
MTSLSAIFKSHDLDIDERIGQFAFGMVGTRHSCVIYVSNNTLDCSSTSPEHNRDPINNTIRKFIEDDTFKYKYENLGLQHKDKVAGTLIGPADSTNTFSL